MNMKKITVIFLSLCLLLPTLVGCDSLFPSDTTTTASGTSVTTAEEVVVTPSTNGLVLNELMASNSSTIADDYGTYSDWIELYNSSSADISLSGYTITDDPAKFAKFVLPDITIKAGEYLVIWASGRNVYNAETGYLHLSFKINAVSEIVSLFSPKGVEIGRITVNNAPTDYSLGPDENGRTMIFSEPTPGTRNVTTAYTPVETEPEVPLNTHGKDVNTVRINEFATDDCITFPDSEGDYGAWVEIYNYGASPVDMTGLFLSDDETKPAKWAFPSVTIGAGEYLLVYMMGKNGDYAASGELQATFTLSGKETFLGIFNGSTDIMDSCKVYNLFSNITCGRSSGDAEHWLFFPLATPGAANTVEGFEDVESARYPAYKQAYINEVIAVNTTLAAAPDGKTYTKGELTDYYDTYDYIELYNPNDTAVNLSDLYIGKNVFTNAVQLPNVQLPAHGYRVIYFGDETKYYSAKDEIYVNMGLNRYHNDLYLFNASGVCVDSILTGTLFDKTSAGRASENDDTVWYFTDVTPGAANSSAKFYKSVGTPEYSVAGGYVTEGASLTLTAPSGCVIYYTTDGSEPTQSSTLYTSPIQITKTVTVRSRCYKTGYLYSEGVSQSYIVGRDHGMPVICLTTEAANLYSDATGIFAEGTGFDSESSVYVGTNDDYSKRENAFYSNAAKYANYWQDWERPVHFDYITSDGKQVLSFNAGIKTFGQYSRVRDQKSVSINLRDKYGVKEIAYPFFGDDYINVFSSIILRASGQDSNAAHIRDAFVAKALVGEINCEVMNYIPVVVYINGEYYGIYDLREHINEDFVADHTGADPNNVDIIKGTTTMLAGTYDNYKALLTYVTSHSMANADNYAYVCTQMDVDNYIDYWIAQIYFANTDPGNIKFYREKTDTAKWRWIPYDFDWSMRSTENRFEMVFSYSSMKVYSILRELIKNTDFKQKFLSRFCTLLNDTLNYERLKPLLDSMAAEISTEMEYHIARWNYRWNSENELLYLMCSSPYSMASWQTNITRIDTWLQTRNETIIKDMKSWFKLSSADITALGYKG